MAIRLTNVPIIRDSLSKYGINNIKLQNAILAVIGKESNFIPKSEDLNYTTVKRFKMYFSRVPDQLIPSLLNNPVALGNYVYSGKYGTPAGAGYLYRGRGLNQITYLDQYKKIGDQLGVDLVKNPDLLNKIEYAAPAAAIYFSNGIKTYRKKIIDKYGVDLAAIKPTDDPLKILKAVVNINAGLGAKQSLVDDQYGVSIPYYKLITKTPVINTTKTILPIILGSIALYYLLKN